MRVFSTCVVLLPWRAQAAITRRRACLAQIEPRYEGLMRRFPYREVTPRYLTRFRHIAAGGPRPPCPWCRLASTSEPGQPHTLEIGVSCRSESSRATPSALHAERLVVLLRHFLALSRQRVQTPARTVFA